MTINIAGGPGPNGVNLAARLDEWRRSLLDTSGRNKLIRTKFGRGGCLQIEYPEFFPLWEAIAVQDQRIEFVWPSEWCETEQDSQAEGGSPKARPSQAVLSESQIEQIKNRLRPSVDVALTNLSDDPLDRRLKRLQITASTTLSEQGINSLFLAFGFLKWFESVDSDEALLSPLVLLPVTLERKSADSTWEISPG